MNQMARSPNQLGVAIQQQRLMRNMSQSELARLVGTSQKTISKIENGNPATKIETVFALTLAGNGGESPANGNKMSAEGSQ
tara:strand:- start:2715 stop:2957 length:243 start_codon:yes stop_codon:yes gene_type:complete